MDGLREKVIRGLECCLHGPMQCEKCPYMEEVWKTVPNCVKNMRTDAISLLKAQEVPDTNAGKWISVKDSLPENIKPVLVWESQGFAYVDNYLDGDWSIGSENGAIITNWMPLPEPPKEELIRDAGAGGV